MPQPYRRAVFSDGALSVPVLVSENVTLTSGASYDESYTFAASVKLEIFVENFPAECQIYDGTAWTSGNMILPGQTGGQMNVLKSTCEGIRLRNRAGHASEDAKISIWRYT